METLRADTAPPLVTPPAIVDNGREEEGQRSLLVMSLAALGVVYGDIGTSPLYAFKQCFQGAYRVAATPENVLGILSLIVWALIIIVSIKYLLLILQADNRGEGGIIALVALLNPWRAARGSRRNILMVMGLFGAALLYGDGTITPAISVLSAIEGLKVETTAFDPYVVPISVVILLALFASQRHGTTKIGTFFGPVMLAWFVVIALLGLGGIWQAPHVLLAFNPLYAAAFLLGNGLLGFIVLGTVFLAVTGAEALYADMGHFGRAPIRMAWFCLALPALLLNYFGQGALVLHDVNAIEHPFYGLSPQWAHYPLVFLATMATVIASQAVISGVFSLTRQAVQLGQLPRLKIVQTDRDHIGQIYVPTVNALLMIATIGLVVAFGSSERLASAYGLAVSADMVITTILAYFVAVRFGWQPWIVGALAVVFLCVDLLFFAANIFKFFDGGWYPVLLAALVFAVIEIWRSGMAHLRTVAKEGRKSMAEFLDQLQREPVQRIPGTAVFMTSNNTSAPPLLMHLLKFSPLLQENVLFVTVSIGDVPAVPSAERIEYELLAPGFHRLIINYGFMQSPNVPVALRFAGRFGVDVDPETATFYLGHEEVLTPKDASLFHRMRTQVFAFLWRNSARATAFYRIPPERVMAIGLQVEM